MIGRYSLPKMAGIWREENKFKKMLQVEVACCEAFAKLGQMPKEALPVIKRNARFDVERIKEIEKKTNHDVVAFLVNLSESIGDEAKYIHMGMTSSDVLDTSLSMMMREAADILLNDLRLFLKALRDKARRFKKTVMIGRSHGIHAEPTTFGLKMALFYDETHRNLKRMEEAKEIISVGKISGAVGTYANVRPAVENYACKRLGLRPANISTQVLQRDRHAQYLTTLAIIGASLEKFATEIRHLQRTEVGEVEEYFSPTQKGSSAMPHKKNPITCERICGLARVLRSNAMAAIENIPLWHERDISHSSVERIIVPDSTILLDYMLVKFTDIIQRLVVREEVMKENLEKTRGVIFSQRVLLELINKGLTRLEAYNVVQNCAMVSQRDGVSFEIILENDKKMRKHLTKEEIDACFDLNYHLAYVGDIFKKVGI
ncbi:adenylosuccinate lyase [Omnitrophica bacterium]|nr:adenylosuccinate lyase [Candidatus Omnitrophota bacterium]